MKRYLIIPGALLAFVLFSAKSCEEDPETTRYRQEEALLEVMNNVKDEFTIEYLDEASLFGFMQKAKQKLRDYSDYMALANDTTIEFAFRTQALAMSDELFYNKAGHPKPIAGTTIQIDSVWIVEPLKMIAEERYEGTLGFREKIILRSGEETADTTQSMKKVDLIVIKQYKVIGSDSLNIWQVFLGDIF